jgi:transcriptional regulator with PAS, ATPase and Fis domain
MEEGVVEALIVDTWLPDLEVLEFIREFRERHPGVELVTVDAEHSPEGSRHPRRNELLYAVQRGQDADGATWNQPSNLASAPIRRAQTVSSEHVSPGSHPVKPPAQTEKAVSEVGEVEEVGLREVILQEATFSESVCREEQVRSVPAEIDPSRPKPVASARAVPSMPVVRNHDASIRLPELIGSGAVMLEVSRRIRLVAPRPTPVLIEGPTGSGKEVVARAIHRLSTRSDKPFVALNCAAIPEALLEAELFGHTRGAFTGAVQGRTGRIESANGGTLFLDEIGELPLGLQAKLLRFVESGELQRVGENEPVRVNVRVLAATHQPLARRAAEGSFRADLFYRLAVFLIRTPSLIEHAEDIPALVEHLMGEMARRSPAKGIAPEAMEKLSAHLWPGNVRELEHVLERASILAGSAPIISAEEIEFDVLGQGRAEADIQSVA